MPIYELDGVRPEFPGEGRYWVAETGGYAFTADDTHAHDDQVDPMVDAINDMLATAGSNLGRFQALAST